VDQDDRTPTRGSNPPRLTQSTGEHATHALVPRSWTGWHHAGRPRARVLHVLPDADLQGLQELHGREVRRRDQDAYRRRRDAHQGGPGAPPEAAAQALHAEVAAGARRAARDACAAPAVAGRRAEVPCGLAVHWPARRPVGELDPQLRPPRPANVRRFPPPPPEQPCPAPPLRLTTEPQTWFCPGCTSRR
jgi:hypothetical protein